MPGSVVKGAFGLVGASKQAGAAKDAARTQAAATDRATDLQRDIFDQTRSDIAPFRQAGLNALDRLQVGLGLQTPGQLAGQAGSGDLSGNAAGNFAGNFAPVQGNQFFRDIQEEINRNGGDINSRAAQLAVMPLAVRALQAREGVEPGDFSEQGRRDAINTRLVDFANSNNNFGRDPNFVTDLLAEIGFEAQAPGSAGGQFGAGAGAQAGTQGGSQVLPENLGTFGEFSSPLIFEPDLEFSQEELEATPGFQFTRDQALQAADRGARARGLSLSGNALMDLQDRAAGIASQRFDNERDFRFGSELTQFNSQTADRSQRLNSLLSMAGFGQVGNQQLAATGSNFANNFANTLQRGAFNTSSANIGASNAQAAGLSAFGEGLGTGINRLGKFGLSDITDLFRAAPLSTSEGFNALGDFGASF